MAYIKLFVRRATFGKTKLGELNNDEKKTV